MDTVSIGQWSKNVLHAFGLQSFPVEQLIAN